MTTKHHHLNQQDFGNVELNGCSASSTCSILYVDDDVENLIGFDSVFSKSYRITTAEDAEQAYAIMKQSSFGVVLVDYKMPKEDGVTFVERIKNEFPNTIFLIVSAWADVDVVIKAINMNCFYGFIQKPWNHHELSITLKNAVAAYQANIENKRLNRELEQRNSDLVESIKREQEANRLKNIFLQNISHEVRTPLNSIIGFSNLIMSSSGDKSIHNFASFISQAGYQLLSTIHGILEASVIFSNKLEMNVTTFDLSEVIQAVINDNKFEALKKGLGLFYENCTNIIIENDKMKVIQILTELVGNAVKFTEQGSVTIRCNYMNVNEIVVSVSDSGIGIDSGKLSQIFEPFRQCDETSTRKYNGNGIGLFIAKSYAEFLGGSVKVESKLGEGTTFKLCLKKRV